MGGKKKTKWRKLPLGELTQGTARGSTVSGSLKEESEDGPRENGYDIKFDEHQWNENRHAGYYAQGPPHFYSTNMAAQGQDDVAQEEAAETDEKSIIFFNGSWIPESDLDQFNTVNTSPYEPFFRQVPVFLCPPVMPYCSAPYPHFRTPYQSDGPLFSNFCIPSDQHYYYYFTRPRTVYYEDEQTFEGEEENDIPAVVNKDANQKEQSPQQEHNCDDGEETQETPLLQEAATETLYPYPYPGYNFGEPLYSVPVCQLLPPHPQRIFPKVPWSSTPPQRKRRRKRKEYNADYAVIPPPKSQGSTRSAAVKCDLGIPRDETTCNNESPNQRKGSDTHSVSVTGRPPSTEETKQNDCVLNNHGSDYDVESPCQRQRESATRDARNLVEETASPTLKEFPEKIPQKVRCQIIDNPASGLCGVPTYEGEDILIAEILGELIQKVVSECQQSQQHNNKRCVIDNCQLTQNETVNFRSSQNFSTGYDSSECADNNASDQVTKCPEYSNENCVISIEFEKESETVEMENILRKNQNADLPQVHKKAQDELGLENTDSNTSPRNFYSKETSDDSFVRKENWKNLSHGRPVKLAINEDENKFVDVTLAEEEAADAVPIRREEYHIENGLKTSENNITGYEENFFENKQQKIDEESLTTSEQNDLQCHNLTANNQSECKDKIETQSDLGCRTDIDGTENYCRVNGEAKEQNADKNGHDSLDSITSIESLRDREKQLSDSHRSSPHSFLSYVSNSEALIQETELELSKIKHLTSRPPLQANQSIYKFAFDENLTDQSETEDAMTPIPSPLAEGANDYRAEFDSEDAAVSAEMRQDIQRSEIVVHEGDSGSEAGSEDVELLPHRYESQGGDKHVYVNKLSLAVELLRTHEKLPYDNEFKRVVEDEGEKVQCGEKEVVITSRSQSNKVSGVPSGTVNPAFVGDVSPKIPTPFGISAPLDDKSVISVVERNPASIQNLQEAIQDQHRHSHISTADSGVQSEDSGDEMGEEVKETYGRLGFTECEEQELWNPTDDATMGYRRFGAQARQRFNIFAPRAGGLNPCFCCIIM